MKHFLLPSLVILPLISLAFIQKGNSDTQLEKLTDSINETNVSLVDVAGVKTSTSFTESKEVVDVSIYTSKLETLTRNSVKNSKAFTEKKNNSEVANDKTITPSVGYYSLHSLIEKYS